MNRVMRHAAGLIFWISVGLFALAVTAIVIASNYVACKAAFELLGFEMRPLKSDEIIGIVFSGFLPDATLAHLYALALTLTLALGFFLLFRLGLHTHALVEDRSAYIADGDDQRARLASRLIAGDVVWMLLFACPVTAAAWWDILLFRYRSVAGALGIGDPDKAAMTIKGWEHQLAEHGDLFAWSAARWGAWGYVAVTFVICLSLEYAFRKIDDTWAKMIAAIDYLRSPEFSADETAQPEEANDNSDSVQDELPPTADVTPPLFPEGGPAAYETQRTEAPRASAQPDPGPVSATAKREGRSPAALGRARSSTATPQTATTAPLAAPARPRTIRHPEEDLRDVIGSGERISLSQARSDEERYSIDSEGNIWNRDYWEQLHDIVPRQIESEPEEAA